MLHRLPERIRSYWLWWVVGLAALGAFLAWPGSLAVKARLALRGLCAQTPSHSFVFDGLLLPFDARMTGIYGGVLATLVLALLRGRALAWGTPPRRVLALLAVGMLAMAVDGFNSLFVDLALPHLYQPRNDLRLLTGFAAGIALGAALVWLLGSSVYRAGRAEPVLGSLTDLAWLWLGFGPYAAVVRSGEGLLYAPLALMLMASAWITMSILSLVVVVLALRLDARIVQPARLHLPGAAAAVIGLGIMVLLAGGRAWLEAVLGISASP